MLRHNEVAAAMHAGYEGGKVAVLAAAKQDREGETPRGSWLSLSVSMHGPGDAECDNTSCISVSISISSWVLESHPDLREPHL